MYCLFQILILRRSIPHKARYKWYHSYCGTSEDEKVLKDLALSQEENLENSIYLDPITDEDINLMVIIHVINILIFININIYYNYYRITSMIISIIIGKL